MQNEPNKDTTDTDELETDERSDAEAKPLGPDSAKKGGRPEDVGPNKGAGSQTPLK